MERGRAQSGSVVPGCQRRDNEAVAGTARVSASTPWRRSPPTSPTGGSSTSAIGGSSRRTSAPRAPPSSTASPASRPPAIGVTASRRASSWSTTTPLRGRLRPDIDGIELMRQVPELADLPVIFISAYRRDETVAKALESVQRARRRLWHREAAGSMRARRRGCRGFEALLLQPRRILCRQRADGLDRGRRRGRRLPAGAHGAHRPLETPHNGPAARIHRAEQLRVSRPPANGPPLPWSARPAAGTGVNRFHRGGSQSSRLSRIPRQGETK